MGQLLDHDLPFSGRDLDGRLVDEDPDPGRVLPVERGRLRHQAALDFCLDALRAPQAFAQQPAYVALGLKRDGDDVSRVRLDDLRLALVSDELLHPLRIVAVAGVVQEELEQKARAEVLVQQEGLAVVDAQAGGLDVGDRGAGHADEGAHLGQGELVLLA
nr:hypothetical protein [Actinocorallia herbida]